MNPRSLEIRLRILDAYEQGTQAQIARRFNVGQATVERLVRLKRPTRSLLPRPHGGAHALGITDDDRERLVTDLEREPDLRQQDLAEPLTREGPPLSRRTVGRSLERLAITRKKSP